MNQVNRGRVIAGGIVGGLVIFLLMGAANHLFLSADWKTWMGTFGGMLHNHSPRTSLLLWLMRSLALGLSGAAVYAGIRPRYGAGGATAIWAGFLIWVAADLGQMLNGLAIGDLPLRIVVGECIAGGAATLIGTYVAAAIYKE